ncbi:DnaD domain protein [Neobacillus sedimentimangrovi]|uniref:DnaD domain protein n=1 Tax=Neobacillus sedimentimangrovi TaxID=2699460 RepID=A0ABS8QFY7_9BACI|nr:DnaD domain protein [Neobacillus sedimentimangrovi]MCD4838142.1 DnaD domain protein [Neobacillus sedimentimangrovi]
MAKFRYVHTEFWQDAKVLEEMTPEDKYFYLYLLTNPNTTQIGVYQITKKQMAFDLGYSIESINALLDRFINNHKVIKYNEKTRELAIINWGKYNLNKAGKPVMDCIKKELADVKDKTLLWEVMNHIPNEDIVNEFSRVVHGTCYDTYHDTSTTRTTIRGEKEKEEEKEEEKEKEEEEVKSSANCFDFYQNNFGLLTPHISQKIGSWLDDFNGQHEIIIKAMEITLERNRRAFSYTEGILKDWYFHKVLTLQDIEAYENEKKSKVVVGLRTKQNKRSLFEQGEESKKRQAAIKPMTPEEEEAMRRMEEELPF